MQPEFWHDRWRSAQIGFHQSAVDRHLKSYWPALELAAGCPVFVPLCGKSLDLLWLQEGGSSVVGVELSPIAVESFFLGNGIPARRRSDGRFDIYEAPRLRLVRGDFFALTGNSLGAVGAVYDRAALSSWAPALRAKYVEHLASLTAPGTKTLLIAMEYPQDQMSGPPFSLTTDEIEGLYGKQHQITLLGREDILANEPRLRSRGLSALHEACYRLTRL